MSVDRHLRTAATQPAAQARLAALVSDTFGPLPPLAALCSAGAVSSSSVLGGVGWGLLAMFFVAILPYFVTWRIRHPSDGGRPSRAGRARYMAIAAGTAAVGLFVLHLLGGPDRVIAAVIAVLVSLTVVAVTNAAWGWSNHMAACAAGVAMLVVIFGVSGLWAALAVPTVAWARLALGRHTPSELVLGALVGAAVSASVFGPLS